MHFKMRPPTLDELNNSDIPHVHLSSDMPWDPSKYDEAKTGQEETSTVEDGIVGINHNNSNTECDWEIFMAELSKNDGIEILQGDGVDDCFLEMTSKEAMAVNLGPQGNATLFEPMPIPSVIETVARVCQSLRAKLSYVEHKYGKTLEKLRPNIAWASTKRVKASLEASTQFYRASQWSKRLKRHYKSRFPGANVTQVNETVCTDTAYMEEAGQSDGISGHGGAKGFQLFVGHDTKHMAAYPIQTDGSFPDVLEDYICTHGAPLKLFTDNARAELSTQTRSILCNYGISDGSSEPHYQNQNAAEREIQDVKKDVAMVMNLTNTPGAYWPLCVEYIVTVKNHTARNVLNDRTPMEKRSGQTPDVSKLLQCRWWEPVYYLCAEGEEEFGRWAGVADHVGDELTYLVVAANTGHAMYRSDFRTATEPNAPNLRAEKYCG
jgi:hypothetical protein